jgi:elongator complex protein 3
MHKLAIQDILSQNPKDARELTRAKRQAAKRYGIELLLNNELLTGYRELVAEGKLEPSRELENLLRKRQIRTLSGIAPVAVLTQSYPCPGKCVYCPNEKDVPQSYLSNEPAVMRAIRCGYDPYIQVQDRIRALEANGHATSKIELIVIGGTWSVLPRQYKYWYLANCFKAANEFGRKQKTDDPVKSFRSHGASRPQEGDIPSLLSKGQGEVLAQSIKKSLGLSELKKILVQEQKKNEKSRHRLVGVTLETRPDYIDEKELLEMRQLGCTRVEIGVQAVDDEVLKINKRGHGVEAIAAATGLLRRFGFKITYHLMPGLPGSAWQKDLDMFKKLFKDPRFQPDQIKFYPTVVTKGSLLYRWWKQGKYQPYSDEELRGLIIECKKRVPRYVRIIRLIRDIPGESIEAGNLVTNLRQVMQAEGVKCECIRCREARDKEFKKKDAALDTIEYAVAGGREYFLSFQSRDEKTLFGFCRLFLPDDSRAHALSALRGAALVRELHIYGRMVSPGGEKAVQHAGLGLGLLEKAEAQARKHGYGKIAVISGVGVRGYYRKLGYRLKDTYMTKKL